MSKRGHVLSAICGIAFLSLAIPRATLADSPFDGTYIGKRVLTKGNSQTCPPEDDVSITIKGDVLAFTNSTHKDQAMGFHPHADGSFDRITQVGGVATIHGRIVGNTLDADVINDPCQYRWHLEKQP